MATAGPRPLARLARHALQPTTRRAAAPPPATLALSSAASRRWASDEKANWLEAAELEHESNDTVGRALGHLGPAEKLPRWVYTPPAMKAPFSLNQRLQALEWKVNEDPEVLDDFYSRFLGPQWPGMLPSELKWLAITHKSFDQGRRGFNDRLSYFGRQAIIFEVTKSIISSPPQGTALADPYDRTPYNHPALAGLENLNLSPPMEKYSQEKVVKLAMAHRMQHVIRWRPKDPKELQKSGLHTVLQSAVQAVVGAIYLQHGAAVASSVLRNKIIAKLDAL